MRVERRASALGNGVSSVWASLRVQTAGMAAGTGLSRLTGLLRILVLAYTLGFTPLADAYNIANNAPNMLYDVVLGGVLSATFIPVFVDRLVTRSEREAWDAISAVVTVAFVVLLLMTVLFWLIAPQIIDAFYVLGHYHTTHAQLEQEKAVATTLLRWFVPQVALYGCISLATALLNTRVGGSWRRCGPPSPTTSSASSSCCGSTTSPASRPWRRSSSTPGSWCCSASAPPPAWPSRRRCSSRACGGPTSRCALASIRDTRRCAPWGGSGAGRSASSRPTRSRNSSCWPWPSGSAGRRRSARTCTPTPFCRCRTPLPRCPL